MKTMLLPALLSLTLIACAPLPTLSITRPVAATPTPTRVTTVLKYTTGTTRAGEDNPVLAAVVAIAPTAPVQARRQPWRAEDIQSNLVVLRSNATAVDSSTFESFMDTRPYEMSFNAIASGGTTTLTATYSSAYAATAQDIFDKLAKKFKVLN
jgi:hypothetical protein